MRKLILFAALCLCAPAAAQVFPTVEKSIVVTGSAEMKAKPDHATVNIGVDTSDKITVKALESNNALMQRVVDAIRTQGVADSDMQTSDFSITAIHPAANNGYGFDYSVTNGYAVSNTLVVSVADVTKVGPIIDAAVRAGANTSNAVSFEAKDEKALSDKVLADAVRDARHNAEVMAAAEGAKVGKVVSIMNTTPPGQYGYASLRVAAKAYAAPVPVMPGEVPVSAQVTVTYAIE